MRCRSGERYGNGLVALEVDDGQHARLWLETKHALVGRLVLPCAGTDQRCSPEVKAFVTVNVPRYEDVGDLSNDQTVLGLG